MSANGGLLIVNADDYGRDRESTDAIVECFDAGTVTSTSAMVYMQDSQRAAEIARDRNLPVGLHLNLTFLFDDPNVPAEVRRRQARAVRSFRRLRVHNWVVFPKRRLYYPWLRDRVDTCVRDQLEAFRALYGREPTHIDGHHHVHLTPTVLRSPALPDGGRMRNHRRRGVREEEFERRRFAATEHYFCLQEVRPFGAEALEDKLGPARRSTLEVEVHPALGERDFLLSDEWRRALADLRVGSYSDLAPRSAA